MMISSIFLRSHHSFHLISPVYELVFNLIPRYYYYISEKQVCMINLMRRGFLFEAEHPI